MVVEDVILTLYNGIFLGQNWQTQGLILTRLKVYFILSRWPSWISFIGLYLNDPIFLFVNAVATTLFWTCGLNIFTSVVPQKVLSEKKVVQALTAFWVKMVSSYMRRNLFWVQIETTRLYLQQGHSYRGQEGQLHPPTKSIAPHLTPKFWVNVSVAKKKKKTIKNVTLADADGLLRQFYRRSSDDVEEEPVKTVSQVHRRSKCFFYWKKGWLRKYCEQGDG